MSELETLLRAVRGLRVHGRIEYERDLQGVISEALSASGVGHRREVTLGPRQRIDLLTESGIGVEVKMGKPDRAAVVDQLGRYATSPLVKVLVLIVERNLFGHPDEVGGKPLHVVDLNAEWGISL